MEPMITKQGSGYLIEWPSLKLEVIAKQIHPSGYKAFCGFMLNGEPIHRSNPTLNSNSGMTSLARLLNKRRPKDDWGIDWDQIVEDLAGILIDTVGEGKADVVLGEVEVEEGSQWRIDNLLLEKQHNLIWADGGTGKSMFALFLSVMVQLGYVNTEHNLMVEPGKVLYLDWETDSIEIAKRSRMVHKGLGVENPFSHIRYKQMSGGLGSNIDKVQDIVYDHDIDMVVIDSLGMAVDGQLEDAGSVIQFFSHLSSLNTTTLVVSHSNRNGQIFGSAYTVNQSRNVWEAKKSASDTGGLDFSLFHRKSNNVGMQPAQSWSMDFKDGAVVYTRGDTFHTDNAGDLSYSLLVYRTLQEEGPKNREYLKDKLKAMKSDPPDRIERNVDVAVSKHKASGKIDEGEDGMLSLATSKGDSWQSL